MLSALYLDLVIEAPLKLPDLYHVHCVAIPINTCTGVFREKIIFLEVCQTILLLNC